MRFSSPPVEACPVKSMIQLTRGKLHRSKLGQSDKGGAVAFMRWNPENAPKRLSSIVCAFDLPCRAFAHHLIGKGVVSKPVQPAARHIRCLCRSNKAITRLRMTLNAPVYLMSEPIILLTAELYFALNKQHHPSILT